ncbi:hypothetical protein ACWGOK_38890 [Streptomyces eurythermus]
MDVTLAAVDVAAVVFTVREKFSRRHILAEARRHLLETLRGREFTRGLGYYIARRALLRYSRRHTVTQPGREAPAADRMTYTADFPVPHRWWIAPAEGTPPRESSRCEWARLASLAVQNAIRDARIRADTATANEATTSAVSAPADHRDLEGETASAPHTVDPPRPGRRPDPGAAGRRRPGPPAGRDARGVPGGPHDRPGDMAAHTPSDNPWPVWRVRVSSRAAGRSSAPRRPAPQ